MTNESKKITETREAILLRILEKTKLYEIDWDNEKTVPMPERLRRLDVFLKERGITPEHFESYHKNWDSGAEDTDAQTFILANGGTITRDELNSIPVEVRSLISQEIYATLLDMTPKQYAEHVAEGHKTGGMFDGLKVTPEHIVDEIHKLWFFKKKSFGNERAGADKRRDGCYN